VTDFAGVTDAVATTTTTTTTERQAVHEEVKKKRTEKHKVDESWRREREIRG
jgi:hypothetical protein